MKVFRRILLVLLVLLVLLPAVLVVVVATTPAGLRLAAGTLDRVGRIGPVTLQIREVSGTLLGGANIGHMEVHHRTADIVANGVSGHLALLPLLGRSINVEDAHVAELSVVAKPVVRNGRPVAPRFLAPLMRLQLDGIRVDHLALTLVNGTRHDVTGISATGTILPKEIRIAAASGAIPALSTTFDASGRLRARAPLQVQLQTSVRFAPEGRPAWEIEASLDGDLDRLPLAVSTSAPFHARLDGTALRGPSGWRVEGKTTVEDLDIAVFGGGKALGLISGTLDVGFDADGLTASGPVEAAGLKTGPMELTFAGQYRQRRLEIRDASVLHLASRTHVTTRGEILLREGGPHLKLAGEWKDLRWPLAGAQAAFHSASGRYTLEGDRPWHVTASGVLLAGGLPSTPFDVAGTLETQRFIVTSGRLDALQGQVQLAGEARWAPSESWNFTGQARGINPVALRPDLPGRVDFDFSADGAPFGARAALSVSVTRLRGRLRNQDLRGSGRIARSAGNPDLRFDGVDVLLGRTHLRLDGLLGTGSRDLRFVLDTEDLSLLDPTARGRVNARGRFAGTTQAPLLELAARGQDFEWKQFKARTLSADLDIDLGAGQRMRGDVHLKDLRALDRVFQEIALSVKGTPAEQRIGLDLSAKPLRVAASATGSLVAGRFDGSIDSLSLQDDRDLHLRLDKATPVVASAEAFSLGDLCLLGDEARLCTGGQWDPKQWSAHFTATELPLAALTAGLSLDVDYNGTINIEASAQGGGEDRPTGKLHAQLTGAELEHPLTNGRVQRMSFGAGEVVAVATPDALELKAGLDAGEAGNLNARLHVERIEGNWRDHPISGSLDLSTDGLGVLDIFLGGIDRASGRLLTKVNVNGTLGAPVVDGLLQLRDAQIDVFQVNLSLRDLTLDATFDTNRLDLTGHSALGEGVMNFSGNLAWRDREPYGQLKISGENLLVADVPEAVVHASPDLEFRVSGRRIDASGRVLLPDVRLNPADLTNAALASGDEVMVGAPVVDPAKRWTVVSDIRLELGDRVHLDAFGLTGRLGGALTVRSDEFGVTRGQGELGVVEGQYAAFGRRLDVTRGRLIFNNEPLGDPGVDLRAQREFPDVTAGVNVRGTLRAPRITFFSEPSLPQWQIASLLLAGGTLQSAQNASSRSAASSLLLAQGGSMLLQRYGSELGIHDVSLETNLLDQSSLVLGRYLSPRLYISYGISLTEAINTLRLRYTISDSWTLKIESGSAQSADLEYTVFR